MAASNTTDQHLISQQKATHFYDNFESDVNLRHHLGISDMGTSTSSSSTKRNSSKHYYQGKQYGYNYIQTKGLF